MSRILGRPIVGPSGNQIGRLGDCVVRLVDGGLPSLTGILLRLQGGDVFIAAGDVVTLAEEEPVKLSADKVDVRPFERRSGEVLLDRDICQRAVIDVDRARLVRVNDLELAREGAGWHVVAVIASPPVTLRGVLSRLLRRDGLGERIDWQQVAPLTGHVPSAGRPLTTVLLSRLKPAEIADIVESASHQEGEEILRAVGADDELEADVFEELDEEHRLEFLIERTDDEAADVLSHMDPDHAVDLLLELPQKRRRPILELLPADKKRNVEQLLAYGAETAGGLMNNEFVARPEDEAVGTTIEALREAEDVPAILTDVYVTNSGRLTGWLTLAALLRAEPSARLGDVMQRDPEAVYPDADLPGIAVQMADYNLATLPVVTREGVLVGIVTYDDLIEAMLPDEWRWRGRPSSAVIGGEQAEQ
ncbi:MAG: magnesium transporter [Acidimicrobiia bacterium]|nr:magnesium transporter [Acidimicrobiia bacterium]